MNNKTITEFGFRITASTDDTLLDLHNSLYAMKAEFINC